MSHNNVQSKFDQAMETLIELKLKSSDDDDEESTDSFLSLTEQHFIATTDQNDALTKLKGLIQ